MRNKNPSSKLLASSMEFLVEHEDHGLIRVKVFQSETNNTIRNMRFSVQSMDQIKPYFEKSGDLKSDSLEQFGINLKIGPYFLVDLCFLNEINTKLDFVINFQKRHSIPDFLYIKTKSLIEEGIHPDSKTIKAIRENWQNIWFSLFRRLNCLSDERKQEIKELIKFDVNLFIAENQKLDNFNTLSFSALYDIEKYII
jgi:hypothetical protein